MTAVIRRQYERAREDLSVRLHCLGDPENDLASVIEGLCAHQLHAGLAAGQVSYASVWETLASAQDAGSREMLEAG
jgi:hypothetical protein